MNEITDTLVFVIFFIYLLIASIFDLKKREVPNWLSFSLLFFALSYRIIQSISNTDIILSTSIVFLTFFILANLLYYGKFFAGGDYKLFLAIAPIVAYPPILHKESFFFLKFLFYCLIVSSVYGFIWSLVICIKNIKKFKIKNQIRERKFLYMFIFSLILLILSLIFYFYKPSSFFIFSALIFFIFPFLYIIINFADKMLVIEKKTNQLVEGDLLYKDIKIGKKVIKAKWDGLTREEIKLLRKHKRKVIIKEGIPFVPVFFLAFIFALWFPFF